MEPVADRSSQNTAIRYISGRTGGLVLIYENRRYRKFKSYKTNLNVLWRCLANPCRGFLTIDGNEDIIKMTDHTCVPLNSAQIEIMTALNDLQNEAATTNTPIPTLYKTKINKLLDKGLNLAAICPKFNIIKSGLYNKRNRACRVDRLITKSPRHVQNKSNGMDLIKMEASETEENNEGLDPLQMEFINESNASEDPHREVEDLTPLEIPSKPPDDSKPSMNQVHELESKDNSKKTCSCQQNDPNEIYANYVRMKLQHIAATDPTQRMLAERIINETLFKAEMGLLTI